MYSINYFERLKPAIDAEVLKKRKWKIPMCKIIEKYISEFPPESTQYILVGDEIATALLNEPRGSRELDEFIYTIYTEHALLHANNLTNKIYENLTDELERRRVRMLTVNPTREFAHYEIEISGELFVRIRQCIPKFNKIALPIICTGFESEQLAVLSPEMILLDVYRTLYTPGMADKYWATAYEIEHKLYKMILKRTKLIKEEINAPTIGSDEIPGIVEIGKLLMQKYIPGNKSLLLIGDYAIEHTPGNEIKKRTVNPVLQVVTNKSANVIHNELKTLISNLFGPGVNVTLHSSQIKLYCDSRLVKHTFKINGKEFIQVFNSGEYDLLPCIHDSHNKQPNDPGGVIQIGNPLVICRFLLVDYYIIRYLNISDILDDHFATARLNYLLSVFISLLRKVHNDNGYLTPGVTLFSPDSASYFGTYTGDETYVKQQLLNDIREGKKIFPYIPGIIYERSGKLRVLKF